MVLQSVIYAQRTLCAILFGLIVLGAGVRLADAGLACPDWPFCLGQAIPSFNFEIFMEWIHRVVAMSVGFVALGISFVIFAKKELRDRVGWLAVISLLLFALQAYLGRETVKQLLRAVIVNAHLMGGYSLLFVNLWMLFRIRPRDRAIRIYPRWVKILLPLLGLAAFFQSTVGGTVSSNYAGLVCPDFPTCQGLWFPGFSGLVGIKFMHRLGAFVLFFLSLSAFVLLKRRIGSAGFVKAVGWASLLIAFQIGVGISMVFSEIHPALSLIHSALAISVFALFALGNLHVFERR